MIGAILTQNTAWSNVERAINRLKTEGALSASFLHQIDEGLLAEWIRPAGYYRVKSRRLKAFFDFFINEYEGQIPKMQNRPLETLRQELLSVKGIGPETADSILLYALGMPTFVVDAYTFRIFSRHRMIGEEMDYEDLRAFFMDQLPEDARLFNEYHALLVRLGKHYCKKNNPLCGECLLRDWE
ncbi:MAG: endonuclease III domain-containing protein [Thermodesulfobacteriota bacterium]